MKEAQTLQVVEPQVNGVSLAGTFFRQTESLRSRLVVASVAIENSSEEIAEILEETERLFQAALEAAKENRSQARAMLAEWLKK